MLETLYDAIDEQNLFPRVGTLLTEPSISPQIRAVLVRLKQTGCKIREDIDIATGRVSAILDARHIAHHIDRDALAAKSPQIQRFDLELDRCDLGAAIKALATLGYRNPVANQGAGWTVYTLANDGLQLTHTDAATTRVRIRWSGQVRGLARIAPTLEELDSFDWPSQAWPLVPIAIMYKKLVRKFRTIPAEIAGKDLGEWLGTPLSLLDELIRFAGIDSADHVVDIGCGDGRVLIHAALATGCRATGIEREADLCARARSAVESVGQGGRVKIIHDEAQSIDWSQATCVFLFLPIDNIDPILSELLAKLPSGARIVAHEHSPYRGVFLPSQKSLLIGERAFTVAYRWQVSRSKAT